MNNTFDPAFNPVQPQSHQEPTPRKRGRISDQDVDPKVLHKRQKAAERQRNKRQRDRQRERESLSNLPGVTFPSAPQQGEPSTSAHQQLGQDIALPASLSKEEVARREKVRAAARERQRKHRALVKQKKMAELGLSMGQDGVTGLEEIHYALGPDGQYQPVMPPNTQPPDMGNQDQAFQPGHGAQTGGQTFASTLLLSFSCSPLLKQHLLRTLHMTNEELCSLEPILSAAWDQWDHARRLHYAEQAAKANVGQQNGGGPNGPPPPNPFISPSGDPQDPTNDFRTRFHRPLTAPSPFNTNPSAHIDPSLGNGSNATQNGVLAQVVQAAKAAAAAAESNGMADAEGGSDDESIDLATDREEAEVTNALEEKVAT
ncbi:hypothetical protein EW145_g4201 [Phellinidium pouzarii]|uniref:Uncharacterized protein n=1 Tax=Phellinidium pouzarii TaxID=167371 RepID=A0A4S4L4C9_9AGAM|nr:hypothetical protein EW145_g4201 [Phellinidium pouzarii]